MRHTTRINDVKTRMLLAILLTIILMACAPESLPILANLPTLTPYPSMSLTPEIAGPPVTFTSPPSDTPDPTIAEVLIKNHEIRRVLWCDPNSDVNMLNEVYADTSDFEMTPDRKLMVSTYIGNWAVEQAGYLTFMKAYYMWDRSTDPYPRVDPDKATQAAVFAQIGRGTRMCPDILDGYTLSLENILLQEDMAVVRYRYGALYEDTLRRIDRRWYVVKSFTLSKP